MSSDMFNLATTSIDVAATMGGKFPFAISSPIYKSQDHVNSAYVRNSQCWAKFNMTGISPWNTNAKNKKAGTAVAPDIIIGAVHSSYTLLEGCTIRFVSSINRVVERTVGKSISINDIAVTKLTEDLPVEIKPLKVLPKDWIKKMPEIDNTGKYTLPVFTTDQNEVACITDWRMAFAGSLGFIEPVSPIRKRYYKQLVTGDSANPACLALGKELVLLCCWSTKSSGPDLSYYTNEINDAMQKLGSKYQLTPAW